MKKVSVLLILLAVAAVAYGGGRQEKNDRLQIMTTTTIITDVVSQISGDRADVSGLMAVGANAHNYEPVPRDMARVEKADLVFVNGFGLEEGLLSFLDSAKTGRVVEVSSGIEVIGFDDSHDDHDQEADHDDHDEEADHDDHDDDDHHHEIDPHTWTSPRNVMVWVDNIVAALEEADPANAGYYRERADLYRGELTRLDDEIRAALAAVPQKDRILVADHKAFNYFARDYGFIVGGALIPRFSTNSEPTARDLAELIRYIKEQDVKALFLGTTSSEAVKKMANAVQGELGYPLPVVSVLTGSLLPAGQEGDDYQGFIRYNVKQIVRGLTR